MGEGRDTLQRKLEIENISSRQITIKGRNVWTKKIEQETIKSLHDRSQRCVITHLM